jgi:ribosomal protein S18 acetylase RimI-like enzyme
LPKQTSEIRIRPYTAADLAQVQTLLDRVGPYRPEDEADLPAMITRAEEARRAGDRWVPLPPTPDREGTIEELYLAFWVAVTAGSDDRDVVGLVGVRRCGEETTELAGLPLGAEWLRRGDVAELRCLRVAPEMWRRGIGARLCRTVIDWSRENQFRSLVLNTTAPQAPARALYRSLGFQEVGRSFIDRYELVWHELLLT